MLAGAGNDRIEGELGNDSLYGEAGNDFIHGFSAEGGGRPNELENTDNDVLDGGDGNDSLHGAEGDDLLLGGAGNDKLIGGADSEYSGPLDEAEWNDLEGTNTTINTGNDTIDGGLGNDIIDGQDGSDTYILSANNDTIKKFELKDKNAEISDKLVAPSDVSLAFSTTG